METKEGEPIGATDNVFLMIDVGGGRYEEDPVPAFLLELSE